MAQHCFKISFRCKDCVNAELMTVHVCMVFIDLRVMLCSDNSLAEGQTDPDHGLIEVPGVSLETICCCKNAL